MSQVTDELKVTNEIKSRNESVLANLNQMCGVVMGAVKDLKAEVKIREDDRCFYDHYRAKLNDLQKYATSSDSKKHEKYVRNQ